MKVLTPALCALAMVALPQEHQKSSTIPTAQDTGDGRVHIKLDPAPPPAKGGRPAPIFDAQKALDRIDALEKKVVELQTANQTLAWRVTSLEGQTKQLQVTAAEYKTHRHNLENNFGFTKQGNFNMVFVNSSDALHQPTSGPVAGN